MLTGSSCVCACGWRIVATGSRDGCRGQRAGNNDDGSRRGGRVVTRDWRERSGVHDAWLGRGERVTVGNQTALIAGVGHQLAVGGQVREHSTPGEGRHNCEIRNNCMVKLCAYVLLEINMAYFCSFV